MGRALRLATMGAPVGGGAKALTYAEYMAETIAPLVWLRFTETAGTTLTNSGSTGAANNGTIVAAGTLAQAGQLGAGEAMAWNGTTTRVTVPQTTIGTLTAWTYGFLVNPATAGEGNDGAFWVWDNSLGLEGGAGFNNSLASIVVKVLSATAPDAEATVTVNLSASAWVYLFFTFSSGVISVYKSTGTAITEGTYFSRTNAGGAAKARTNAMEIGNRTSADFTFNGLIDEVFIVGRALSEAEMLGVAQRAFF